MGQPGLEKVPYGFKSREDHEMWLKTWAKTEDISHPASLNTLNIDDVMRRDDELVLFGASGGGTEFLRFATSKGYKCKYFIDNDPDKWGKVHNQLPVKPLDALNKKDFSKIVICSSIGRYAIWKQLEDMGFKRFQDFFIHTELLEPRLPDLLYVSPINTFKLFLQRTVKHGWDFRGKEIMHLGVGKAIIFDILMTICGVARTYSTDITMPPIYPCNTLQRDYYKTFRDLLISEYYDESDDWRKPLLFHQPNILKGLIPLNYPVEELLDKIVLINDDNISLNPSRIIYMPANGESLPFKDNTFDFVFSSVVLEHIEMPQKAIQEIFRVLKPGGHTFHVIDLKDHRDRWRPHSYLAYSDKEWKEINSGYRYEYGNRWRGIQFRKWFEGSGFYISEYLIERDHLFQVTAEEREGFHPDFRTLDLGELEGLTCQLYAIKPGAV